MDSSQVGADAFGGLVPLYNGHGMKIKQNLHFRSKFRKSLSLLSIVRVCVPNAAALGTEHVVHTGHTFQPATR